MTTTDFELRLSAVESELAKLKAARHVPKRSHPVSTLDAIHGTFENDAAFQDAMRRGRKWRHAEDAKARRKLRAKSR